MGRQRPIGAILDELCLGPAGDGRYSNTELARTIGELGGSITPSYLSHLRNGERDNPTLEILEYLAAALNVSPAVFVGGRRERHGDEWPRRTFSRRLSYLFAVVFSPGRGPWSPDEVAASITAEGTYGSISAGYIRELLNPPSGTLPNPRLKHVLGLAAKFGLARDGSPHAAYFLDDDLAKKIDGELADLAALRSAGVIEFVTRIAKAAPTWRPGLRRQVVEAFTHAIDDGEADWVFPAPRTPTDPEAPPTP